MGKIVLNLKNVDKKFGEQVVFKDFNMKVKEGEFITVVGKSGSGKSTLLNMIGLLDSSDNGVIELFDEKNIKPFSKKANRMLREKIGYLFQNFALISNETVYYNMQIAIKHYKFPDEDILIKNALEKVGLKGFEDKKVFKCSGGEQQRIAIARLIIKPCELILADEPTGSLDKENKEEIFKFLVKMNEEGKTLIVVTHDYSLIDLSHRNIEIN
ncbi:MAG: putative bacteriocin export ABC transporter [Mollicutes bacterium]|jgi:putative ABC transport system ATP-binding protein|nr:putative bacteriocin export ABC transporter [Mollicutes bacterium]